MISTYNLFLDVDVDDISNETTNKSTGLIRTILNSRKYFQNEDSKLVSKINKYNQTKYDPNAKVYKPHEYHK